VCSRDLSVVVSLVVSCRWNCCCSSVCSRDLSVVVSLVVSCGWNCCCSSVCSRDLSVVVSVCEFLMDVVFQDFPAEVFLQRPSIVKVSFVELYCLLISTSAIDCLMTLVPEMAYYGSSCREDNRSFAVESTFHIVWWILKASAFLVL